MTRSVLRASLLALRRRTTSGHFVPEIDGLRFPAIALVVVGHLAAYVRDRSAAVPGPDGAGPVFDALARNPGEGVVLFFIISGFVLALPFARHHLAGAPRVALRDYFLRRITRLEPPYLISLVGFLALKLVAARIGIGDGAEPPAELVEHALVSAVYLHNLVYGTGSLINGVYWSLEIEIQFYVLVPLLTVVFAVRDARVRRGAIVVAGLLAAVLQTRYIRADSRLALSVLGSAQYFLAGFLLADLFVQWPGFTRTARHAGWDVVALVGWPAVLLLWNRGAWTPVLVPAVGALLFVAAFLGPRTNRVFTNPWVTTLGGMCYTIYLIHFPLIAATGRVLARVWPERGTPAFVLATRGPLLLAVVLAVSVAFYRLVEQPCMDRHWPRRLGRWLRGEAGSPRPSVD